jgi:methionine-gamma-lyase
MNSLEVCTIATSLGEEHTLVQMDGENLIRIALGLESSKDIINDFVLSIGKIK